MKVKKKNTTRIQHINKRNSYNTIIYKKSPMWEDVNHLSMAAYL